MKRICILYSLFICVVLHVNGQRITVKADNYLQNFEGAGISAGLYMGHHWSMPSEVHRDNAVKLIAKDCNMQYLQDYIDIYPVDDPGYFDRRANYIKACKVYSPNMQISMVGNKFPRNLKMDTLIGGKTYSVLNTLDPDIYNKVADWYYQLFLGFKVRGVDVDVLNVVNEPDYDKVYYYGPDGNTQRNVALIFDKAVTKFFEILNNPAINTLGMKIPKVMGPSTISPNGCVSYLRYFKTNYPQVFTMIDIVAYHQYINGTIAAQLNEVKVEAAGKPIFQSEMHTNRGDDLGTLPISDELRGCISLARVFGTSVRNGANCWFYFQTNYPNSYTPAGLLFVEWQSTTGAIPYKHYYAFKQLTSAQPVNSKVVVSSANNTISGVDIVSFRKTGSDTLFLHVSNLGSTIKPFILDVVDSVGAAYKIVQYQQRRTTATLNDEVSAIESFATPPSEVALTLEPYSVNTYKVVFKKDPVVTSINTTTRPAFQLNMYQTADLFNIATSIDNSIHSYNVFNASGALVLSVANINRTIVSHSTKKFTTGVYVFNINTKRGTVSKKIFIN
jgi:hypothetical protein